MLMFFKECDFYTIRKRKCRAF